MRELLFGQLDVISISLGHDQNVIRNKDRLYKKMDGIWSSLYHLPRSLYLYSQRRKRKKIKIPILSSDSLLYDLSNKTLYTSDYKRNSFQTCIYIYSLSAFFFSLFFFWFCLTLSCRRLGRLKLPSHSPCSHICLYWPSAKSLGLINVYRHRDWAILISKILSWLLFFI